MNFLSESYHGRCTCTSSWISEDLEPKDRNTDVKYSSFSCDGSGIWPTSVKSVDMSFLDYIYGSLAAGLVWENLSTGFVHWIRENFTLLPVLREMESPIDMIDTTIHVFSYR
jgi:hypothetical protein